MVPALAGEDARLKAVLQRARYAERDADRRRTGVFRRFFIFTTGRPVFGHRGTAGTGRGAPLEEDRLIARPEEEKVRVNQMIRARQVRVIDDAGNQLGIMSPVDAIREAEERSLDLVEVAGKAVPPVGCHRTPNFQHDAGRNPRWG